MGNMNIKSTEAREEGFDAQTEALFGSSLFGPMNDPDVLWEESGNRRGKRRRPIVRRLALAGSLSLFAVLAWWVIDAGLDRSVQQKRAGLAEEIELYLNQGDLQRVTRFMTELQSTRVASRKDPHSDLILRADAMLFRYLDADPQRRQRLQPLLDRSDPQSSADRVLATALLCSRAQRLAMVDALQKAEQAQVRNPTAAYLIGTALQQAGDADGAARAFARASDRGPDNLLLLAGLANFEHWLGRDDQSQIIAEQMRDEDPKSPWTQMVSSQLTGEMKEELHDVLPPVAYAELCLGQALRVLKKGQGEDASSWLDRAAEAVHWQIPFLSDYADRLEQAGYRDAVKSWTRSEKFRDKIPTTGGKKDNILAMHREE